MAETNVYNAPDAELAVDVVAGDYEGIRRLPYFGYSMGVQVLFYLGLFLVGESGSLFLMAALVGTSMWLVVMRLKNTGWSGWWALGMFVPLLNFYVGLRALAFPEGYSDHKTLDTPAKILIGLFVGFIVLGIGAAIIIPAIVAAG